MKFHLFPLTIFLLVSLLVCFAYADTHLGSFREFRTDHQLIDHVMKPYSWNKMYAFLDSIRNFTQPNRPYSMWDVQDDVKFYLYNNPGAFDHFHEIKNFNSKIELQKLPWIPAAPIKILIHGFTQSQNTSMPGVIKNAYLENMKKGEGENVNIIVVDWGRLASSGYSLTMGYSWAVGNVEKVGECVGNLIINLENFGFFPYHSFHIIGFSLGSHVAGHAGLTVRRHGRGEKIGRITGLDPAGPAFYIDGLIGRTLGAQDAVFVDIIYTSIGSYGTAKKLGHVRFYLNRGYTLMQTQPFCDAFLFTWKPIQVCSHNMAPVFYAMSIFREYEACESASYNQYLTDRRGHCKTTATLGEHCDNTIRGDFYLEIPRPLYLRGGFEQEFDHSLKMKTVKQGSDDN